MIPVLDIYLTGQCNFKCSYCYGESTDHFFMDISIYEKVLSYAKKIGADISFTGGEPLLHPEIKSFVKRAKNQGINIHLHTNSILFENHIDIIKYFNWVSISLDGTKEVNHKMRPSSSNFKVTKEDKFNIPINNLRLLKEKHPNVNVLIATVATSVNLINILELSDYLFFHNVPFDKWKIYQFTANNFRSILTKKHFSISIDSLKNIEEKIIALHPKAIFKYGDGNCVLVSVNGDIRINNEVVSHINEQHDTISENITKTGLMKDVKENSNYSA